MDLANVIALKNYIRRSTRNGAHWMVLGTGVASAYILLLCKQVKRHEEKHVTRINGRPEVINTETAFRAEDVKRSLDWYKHSGVFKQTDLHLFPSKDVDMSNKGCLQLICGAAVGVPAHFTTNFLKEAKENPSLLLEYSIDVRTDEGRQMYDLLKQKDKEIVRLYALAREMCQARSSQHAFVVAGITLSFSSCFHIAKLLQSVLRFTLLSYFVTIPSVVYGSLQAYDFLNREYEKRLDREAAFVSEFAAVGGVEYFDYLIAKEQLLKDSALEKHSSNVETSPFPFFDPSQWLLEYRKPNLSLEERRTSLLAMIAKVYGGGIVEQTKGEDKTEL